MARIGASLALALCLCAVAASAVPGQAKGKDGIAFGLAAISHLGPEIARIAREYDFGSETKLRDLILADADLGVDKASKRLVYVCSGMEVTPGADGGRHLLTNDHHHGHDHHHYHQHGHDMPRKMSGLPMAKSDLPGELSTAGRQLKQLQAADTPDPDATKIPASVNGVPLMHSRPSATRKIFLDFDGHVTSGAKWASGATITTPAYDADGNPASFSATEKAYMYAIWRAVAEDFAAFDVDVTTEDPGYEGLYRTDASDVNYGTRVAIGGSSYDWYGSGAGGVAYVDVFNMIGADGWQYQPAFVFTASLNNGFPKYVWEAVSHEVGHNFGLWHDGKTDGTAYYQGHGDWAPIMGVGYYEPITQWSKGEYAIANQLQDDIALIARYTPLIADDYSNTASAAAVPLTPGTTAGGILGSGDAADYFSILAGAGTLSVTASVVSSFGSQNRANLDILLRLSDASGTEIMTANTLATAGAGLPATLTTNLAAAGTYFISVHSTGFGSPLDTGYSSYGSMGQYAIKATFTSGSNTPNPPPRPAPSPPPPVPVPSAPLALSAVRVSIRKNTLGMDVSFTDGSTDEGSFRLERCASTACSSIVSTSTLQSPSPATSGATVTMRDSGNIRAGTSYSYRVRACSALDGSVCSAPSTVVTGTA